MIYISEGKRVYSAYKYNVNIIILWDMASDTTVVLVFTKSKNIYTTDLYLHEHGCLNIHILNQPAPVISRCKLHDNHSDPTRHQTHHTFTRNCTVSLQLNTLVQYMATESQSSQPHHPAFRQPPLYTLSHPPRQHEGGYRHAHTGNTLPLWVW